MKHRLRFLILPLTCLFLVGCVTEKPTGPRGSFSVKVAPFFGKDVRVYIHAREVVDGQRGPVLSSGRVTGDGITGFVLPAGKTYAVGAYADLDGDGRPGPDDPAASISGLRPEVDVNASQPPFVLTLPGAGVAPDWPQKKSASGPESPGSADLQRGIDQVREAVPGLPIPPLPVPPKL